jgi:hypothetical protein
VDELRGADVDLDTTAAAVRTAIVSSVDCTVPRSFAANSCRALVAYSGSTICVIRLPRMSPNSRTAAMLSQRTTPFRSRM